MKKSEDLEVKGMMKNVNKESVKTLARCGAEARTALKRIKILAVFSFAAIATAFAVSAVSPRTDEGVVLAKGLPSGAELFENNCARCHGSDGKGGKGPNLASEKKQAKWKDSDEKLIKKITNGGLFMPSFGKKLAADEIKLIADHVRTLKE